ncbi:repair family protein [Mycobacterium ulcerans str. Harvey]|uniref:Repair family protein n=1 Tax=Mycobacterium ulcerans str. Harvey TaxID=1299332 RepID=A0ABN0R2E6_MYCUL|nr:repair family protein [Mycobacterium ulcerans str. Harvey]
MRIPRLLGVILMIFTTGLLLAPLLAPPSGAQPPFRLASYVTDNADALTSSGRAKVTTAVNQLYTERHVRLWVVYVDDFSGQSATNWAQRTMQTSELGDYDAILAVATVARSYAFLVPSTVDGITSSQVESLRRNKIEPKLRDGDWAGAAVAAADGLNKSPRPSGGIPLLVVLSVLAVAVAIFWIVMRYRASRRRTNALAAARRVDPTDAGLSPRCRWTSSTNCPGQWWSMSTTPCAPVPMSSPWRSTSSANNGPRRFPRRYATPKLRYPKRLACVSSLTTAPPRHPRSGVTY